MYKSNISCSKNIGLGMHKLCKLWQCNSTFKKNVNCIWTIINCYALGNTGRYSLFIFRIPTVFDIIPLELVHFQNTRFSVSLRSFSCPALRYSLSFSYSNVKVENGWGGFSTISVRFHPWTHNAEGRRSCTCREEPKTGPSLGTSEHQHDCSGICLRLSYMSSLRWYTWKKIVWRTNMEKTLWRYMEIREYLEKY